ncbi:MAG: hypothetical protein ACK4FL_00250 [Microgenomates group bacterium]
MIYFWDYDVSELKKTKEGRIKILERMINYGVYLKDKEKIPLSQVKKYWERLKIDPGRRNFLKFVIWGK